jgi:hypothetical protein
MTSLAQSFPEMAVRPESVLMGRDPEAIERLMGVHAPDAPRILDATHNTGKMWKGCSYQPDHTLDIDPQFAPDTVGDFRSMPIEDESFEVIVFDPPHLPVAMASQGSSEHPNVVRFRKQYGLTADAGMGRGGDNVCEQFGPFLLEARRVLTDDGIVLAKLADLIHNHRYQWQVVDFIVAVRQVDLTPCDLLIKRDPAGGNLKSSKWKNVHHLRRVHSNWIVVRKGRCERAVHAESEGER